MKHSGAWLAVALLAGCRGVDPAAVEALLRPEPYSRLVIEVDYSPRAAPDFAMGDVLAARLGEVIDKPGGIEVVFSQSIEDVPRGTLRSGRELEALLAATADGPRDARTLVLRTLLLSGSTAGYEDSLGTLWGDEVVLLFADDIAAACAESSCFWALHYVWLHELGHRLGLVDYGTPALSAHGDRDDPVHCVEAGCVMGARYPGAQRVPAVPGGPDVPDRFGPACLADLAGW